MSQTWQKWMLLFLSIITSFIIISSGDNTITHVLGLLVLVLMSIHLSDYQLIHPYFWFSSIFFLYACSFPILNFMGFEEFTYYQYTKQNMICQWIALSSFLVFFTPYSLEQKRLRLHGHFLHKFSKQNLIFLRILEILLFLFSIKILMSGYSSKKDIQAAGDIYFSIGERLAMMLDILFTLFVAAVLSNKIKLKAIKKEFIFSLVPILSFVLSSGDRSALFKYVFYLMIILFTFGVIKKKQLFKLLPLGIFLMLLSNVFRYVAMRGGEGMILSFDGRELLYEFLTSDFHCAGRNMEALLTNESQNRGLFGYSLIFNDVLFTFYRGDGVISVSEWFNNKYFSSSIFGQAFTLVGEGYLIDGYLGIIVLFSLIALLFRFLYNKSINSIYWLITFVVMAAGLCFALREMLMAVLSPLVRQCLPVFLIATYLNNKKSIISIYKIDTK